MGIFVSLFCGEIWDRPWSEEEERRRKTVQGKAWLATIVEAGVFF